MDGRRDGFQPVWRAWRRWCRAWMSRAEPPRTARNHESAWHSATKAAHNGFWQETAGRGPQSVRRAGWVPRRQRSSAAADPLEELVSEDQAMDVVRARVNHGIGGERHEVLDAGLQVVAAVS